jgi:hypothetical protein
MATKNKTDERTVDEGRGQRKEADRCQIEIIKVSGEDTEGREVAVRCEKAARRKEKASFGWHEEFAFEWSETFITKK